MGGTASDRRPLDPINKIRDAFIHRPTGASSEQNFLTLFLLPKFPGLLYTFLPGGIATTADELFTPFKQDVGDGGGGQFLLKGFDVGVAVKNRLPMQETQGTQVQFLSREHPVEEEMGTHCRIRTTPWTEGPRGLQSMGSKEPDTADHNKITTPTTI